LRYRIFIAGLSNDALTCLPILPNKHRSIREYLSEKRRKLRIFSTVQIIGSSIDDCDFRERFSDYEGAVAVDLDERFCDYKFVKIGGSIIFFGILPKNNLWCDRI